MDKILSAAGAKSISILYTDGEAKQLADFVKWDLEWLLEIKIATAEMAPVGTAPPGVSQVVVTILLTPFMKTAWKAVIHSMKRGLSKHAGSGVGGRLILRDLSGAMQASFLFQGFSDMVGISDSIKTMLTA
ncbi:MAG TPA: hypothetical protein VJ385_04475 [Fibrobacteria bacterium]|nr:hypothetical protein [Fibrobacteria bacterium]